MNSLSPVITLTLHPAIDRVVKLDRLQVGGTLDATETLRVPAGKGVNTARSLSALLEKSAKITAAVWLGSAEAAWFNDTLKSLNGITTAVCPRDCPTRFAVTYLESTGCETHIKEAMRPASSAEQKALLKFWANTIARGSIVALCGSAPAKCSATTIKSLFKIARERGARFILADTNGVALQAAGSASIDLLKGNAAEIGQWLSLNQPFDPEISAHTSSLNQKFKSASAPRMVMITLGAAGAVLAQSGKIFRVRPPKLKEDFKIVSATGCGDAATAGAIWSVLLNEPPEKMLGRAVPCGTAKLAFADPGRLSKAQAETNVRYCRTEAL